ncbi:MAG: hypothetical protein WCR91_03975 [Sphaerochaetaceae bacterium]
MAFRKIFYFMMFVFSICVVSISASSNQRLRASDADAFLRIQQLFRIHQLAVPVQNGPWTDAELQFLLGSTSEISKDSVLEQSIYEDLHQNRRFLLGQGSSDVSLHYGFETYIHTN